MKRERERRDRRDSRNRQDRYRKKDRSRSRQPKAKTNPNEINYFRDIKDPNIGLSSEEIQRLEEVAGEEFHHHYRNFLKKAGKRSNAFSNHDEEMTVEKLIDLQTELHEKIQETMALQPTNPFEDKNIWCFRKVKDFYWFLIVTKEEVPVAYCFTQKIRRLRKGEHPHYIVNKSFVEYVNKTTSDRWKFMSIGRKIFLICIGIVVIPFWLVLQLIKLVFRILFFFAK